MIPVLIVPVLTRPELLYRMIASIDHPVDRLLIIDNGECVSERECSTSRMVQHLTILRMPANLGVAGSWNLGIKATPFALWWLIANFDIVWPAGSLAAMDDTAGPDRIVLVDSPQPWCAFALGEQIVAEVGLFDEALHPAYMEDDDYARRCHVDRALIVRSQIPVWHDNSSTLAAGYADRNRVTFAENAAYYDDKVRAQDYSEGAWSLERRRRLSWD